MEVIVELKKKCKDIEENCKIQLKEFQDKLKVEYIQKENVLESEFDFEK